MAQLLALAGILVLMNRWRATPFFARQAYTANVIMMSMGFCLMGFQLMGLAMSRGGERTMQQQQGQFAVHKAPQMPLSLSHMPKGEIVADAAGHVRGIDVDSSGLIRSTVTAAAVAAGLLVVFYLPSERGMDPTGLGGAPGLTEMGEIKQQPYAEDAADAAFAAGALPAEIATWLAGIEAQLAELCAVYGIDFPTAPASAPVPEIPSTRIAVPDTAPVPASVAPAAVPAPAAASRDEASHTLAPGERIEGKLAVSEGQTAEFEWTADGGVMNYDTHGDDGGQSVSYEQGRSVSDLTAAFTGNHGWFWRNCTEASVKVTLRTRGDDAKMNTFRSLERYLPNRHRQQA